MRQDRLGQTPEGYSVSSGLPGCWSRVRPSKAMDNIREAIVEYMATADELLEAPKSVRSIAV